MKKKPDKDSFEHNLNRLEEISIRLESENVTLDEALTLYEEGIKLSKICMETLKNAELKITELKKLAGEKPAEENYENRLEFFEDE